MADTATMMQGVDGWQKYRLNRASRPFSMVVAVATCLQGIILGWHESAQPFLLAFLIISGGLLLQLAVNLINDHSDLAELDQRFPNVSPEQKYALIQLIQRNYRVGLLCFFLAGICGLILMLFRGTELAVLFITGLAGAYFYTQPPVSYKTRGLGIPLVFWLMGVLMIGGAYYSMAGRYHGDIFLNSLPLSLLTALLLLSNELRDFESDSLQGQKTLTVRWGYDRSSRLYYILILLIYLWVPGAAISGVHNFPWLTLLALPLLIKPLRLIAEPADQRVLLTPLTGRFYAVFSMLLLAGYGLFPVS